MNIFDVYPQYDITPIQGDRMKLYDSKGKAYLDLYGGHGVISIGHAHSHYVKRIQNQVFKLGFYSNSVKNPLQHELSEKLGALSSCEDYQLFLCNSGAEANENALKLASFETGKSRVISFENSFHGRTSAAVAITDNPNIIAPINAQQEVTFLELGDLLSLSVELKKGDVCAVVIEFIQGIGGINESSQAFYEGVCKLCKNHNVFLIADEVQSGYGRTGDFFAFQKYKVTPDIISVAKGMGNGFPIGGVLIHPRIKPIYGMLGSTFGGNHLACTAAIAVLDVMKEEQLMAHVKKTSSYFIKKAETLPFIKKIKGRGLMLGFEFDFEVGELRKNLLYTHHIFTGNSTNTKLLRLLPPLCVQKEDIDRFFEALEMECALTANKNRFLLTKKV